MARDDWRILIRLPPGQSGSFLARLGLDLAAESRELAADLRERRLVVSTDEDDNEIFVYAASRAEAEQARAIVETELAEARFDAEIGPVEQWLDDEDRWETEPPGVDVEDELLARGDSPWEVRVPCESRAEAARLEQELEAEGYAVDRRWRYLVIGAGSEDEARELARRLHGEAEPTSELVWEVVPQNPFVVFGGLGGSGTPL